MPLVRDPSVDAAPGTAPRRYAVVGTAGHIDHGKSALVRALTGTDPDRLLEEKRRGMTIDLGFAYADLPSGIRVGFVDVPGHERLIRNMLAGAAGVDLVLLVVASDEGVMPQTREHLDILRFLRIRRGLVVLNKVDLVTDPEWLDLVREDVAALCAGTFLEGAPILPVSARTGEGLPELVAALDRALGDLPPRDAEAPMRLPVDRSFTMAGFGTVVTGTLWAGRVKPGDVLVVLPAGREVRVRHVQSHGTPVEEARAGQRVALNLVGVAKEEVPRGSVLAPPGSFLPTQLADIRVRLLPTAPPLDHHARVRLYVGADEVIGRIRLLDRSRLGPGEEAVAQIRFERPAVVARGDPFVLRRYSPMTTIGGGEVIVANAPLRRRGAETAELLAREARSGFDAQVLSAIQRAGRTGTTVELVAQALAATRERVAAQVASLLEAGEVIQIRGRLFGRRVAEDLREAIVGTLERYHQATPWRGGMPREDLKVQSFGTGDDRLYGYVLEELQAQGGVVLRGDLVARRDFTPQRSGTEEAARRAIEEAYRQGRFTPPSPAEVLTSLPDRAAGERMLQTLLDEGVVVEVGEDVLFHRDVLEEIRALVVAHIARHGEITVATLRDLLGSSRKYTVTVLEYFDALRVTRRIGDRRVLAAPPARS